MVNEEKLKLQREALEALKANNYKGIVILPTGAGKTLVLIEALKQLYRPNMRVLYTCDSARLRDVDFNKELVKWQAEDYVQLIDKQCYKSAYKMKGQHYHIGLFDEGDYALTSEYSKLFFENTFDYIIFVSATLDSKKQTMARKIAPIVYSKKVKDIEEKKVINKCQFVLVPFRLTESENKRYLQFNKTFVEYLRKEQTPAIKKRLEFLQIERAHFLAGLNSSVYICKKLMVELYMTDPKSKILVFCGLNAQADAICKYSYHGDSEEEDNLNKFDKGDITVLSVCGKINRGVNLNGVNTIIIENPKRSETIMTQRTGRGRRLNVDEILYIYLMIPYFKTDYGLVRPTIVMEWVKEAAKDMGIEKAKTHIIK
jgi:superfamily II DNA or RNA helicase